MKTSRGLGQEPIAFKLRIDRNITLEVSVQQVLPIIVKTQLLCTKVTVTKSLQLNVSQSDIRKDQWDLIRGPVWEGIGTTILHTSSHRSFSVTSHNSQWSKISHKN